MTPHSIHPRGVALVEAIIATLILSLVVASAMQVAGISAAMQAQTAQYSTGRALARALADDIANLAYRDPGAAPVFGREAGETALSKANYNDVDDFNGWTESPPQDAGGTAMAGLSAYTRSVVVAWVTPADLTQTSVSETGAKRIIVTVSRGSKTLAVRTVIRTSAP